MQTNYVFDFLAGYLLYSRGVVGGIRRIPPSFQTRGKEIESGGANMASASEPKKIFGFAPPRPPSDDFGGVYF